MKRAETKHKIVFIVGPTAAGKSEFAIRAAKEFSGKLVNCDSLQFYQGMDIGTAKPSLAERQLVPHLLYDVVAVGESLTAGGFREMALSTIEKELPHSHLFFVGGSGFYIQALDKGMFDVGPINKELEESIRQEISQKGTQELFKEIKAKDPRYAATISPNDHYRVFRAICLLRSFNRPVSELQDEFVQKSKRTELKAKKIKIGIKEDREVLRQRVQLRTQKMLQLGLIDEVRELVMQGHRNWPPLKSIGYKEVLDFIDGHIEQKKLEDEIVKNTMRLAKKQMTWFRRDIDIHWFQRQEVLDKGLSFLRENL